MSRRPGKLYRLWVFYPYKNGSKKVLAQTSYLEPTIVARAKYYKALGFDLIIEVLDRQTLKYIEHIKLED